jgi:mitogen-activated protein kinase kinase kinase 9
MANLYVLNPKERIEQVECGSIHTIIRTSMHRLFSCGNGSTYALGHGSKDTCKSFKQIQYFNGEDGATQLTGVGIRQIACGLMHSGCILSDGSVYQWGTCGDYQYLYNNS